jgi:hypothetical protein
MSIIYLMCESYVKYLQEEKTKGMQPERTAMASLLYLMCENFMKENQLSFSDLSSKKYFDFECICYKEAFFTVFGKKQWALHKKANKKIRGAK